MGVLYSCMYICVHVQCPRNGVLDDCEPPCGWEELNPAPLEEHLVLLSAEPSLQPFLLSFGCPFSCLYFLLLFS